MTWMPSARRVSNILPTRLAPATVLALGLGIATRAGADVLTEIGAGARSTSLAGGGAALVDDYSAVFLAPAAMAFSRPSIGVAFVGGANRLGVRLSQRPRGYDAPDLGASSPMVPYRYRLESRRSPAHPPGPVGFAVGASTSLGVEWLRVGALAFVPIAGLGQQYTYFADEREQYFSNTLHHAMYGQKLASQETLIAGAARLARWLSVGAGMRFQIQSSSDALALSPNAADPSVQEIDLRTDTGIAVTPVASVAARTLGERLRFALTFRDESSMRIAGVTQVQVNGFQGTSQYPVYQPMSFVTEFIPRQLVVAAAYRTPRWAASGDAIWSQWSGYRDDHDQPAPFSNTWRWALGGEVRTAGALWVRGGLGYRPTPVPPQTGRTNYVDNDMWIFGLGVAYTFVVASKELELSAFSQLQAAVPRTETKTRLARHPGCAPGVTELCDEVADGTRDPLTGGAAVGSAGLQTGNPGFPGYTAGGWISVAGVQVSWRYE
jgi:long-subunit fatty acid transport protein